MNEQPALPDRPTSGDVRTRTVLDVLAGRQTVAGAAAHLGVSRQTIHNWRAAFVAAGAARLGEQGPPTADAGSMTDDRVPADPAPANDRPATDPATRRAESMVVGLVSQLRSMDDGSEIELPVLEAIRTSSGLSVARFCELTGIPRRTYYTRRATPGGHAAPAQTRIAGALEQVAANHPEWGARRVWRQLVEVEGLDVSLATVKRALTRRS